MEFCLVVLYKLGLTQPNKEPTRDLELFEKNIANQLITILFALNFWLSATIQTFDNVYGFEEGEQRSKTCIAQMEKIEWLSKKS